MSFFQYRQTKKINYRGIEMVVPIDTKGVAVCSRGYVEAFIACNKEHLVKGDIMWFSTVGHMANVGKIDDYSENWEESLTWLD